MDSRAVVHVEIEREGHKFSFCMPMGAPLGCAYNAAFDILQHIVELSKKAADRAQQPEEKEKEQCQGKWSYNASKKYG